MKILLFITVLVVLLLPVAGINAQKRERNFFLETWQAKRIDLPLEYKNGNLSSGVGDATVTIDLQDTINPVLPTQLGVNTTFRSGHSMLERLDLYNNSGWGAYRFPAGSGSNTYFWGKDIPDTFKINVSPIRGNWPSYLTPADFVQFTKSTKSEGTVVVNYFYARYGVVRGDTSRRARVLQAAKYAAGFVRKLNIENGANIKYWEVGNECYGRWEKGFTVDGVPTTGSEYGQDFNVFAEEMKKVDPRIKVGAVVYSRQSDWNKGVIAETKDHADFFVVHNYFVNKRDTAYKKILSTTHQVADIKKMLGDMTETYAGKPRDYFPLAMTEYNFRGMHTTTMASAIFIAEIIGEFIRNGFGMATLWVGEWNWSPGTHGIIAKNDPDQENYSPRQAYFDFRYYRNWFGDYLINSATDGEGIKTYASRFSDGKAALVIINQNPVEKNVKINIENIPAEFTLRDAWWYEVYADNINEGNKKFYINGETGTTPGGGPVHFENIKPYKAEFSNGSVFRAKKYSVNFIVIDLHQTTGFGDGTIGKEIISPNPATDYIDVMLSGVKHPVLSVKVYNLLGNVVVDTPPGPLLIEGEKIRLDVSGLAAGVYFVRVGGRMYKFVKM
jgi:hypothetical protein